MTACQVAKLAHNHPMQTERFNKLRKRELEAIFDKKRMVKIWRDIVRDQMRSQDILDLYDCYDLNFNIEERVKALFPLKAEIYLPL